jgi:transposase InsO family protein
MSTKTKNTKAKQYNELMETLELDETYTKSHTRPKFDNIKSNIPPLNGYNYQCDLLELPLTKKKFHYLLVIVDLWSDIFDCRPLTSKTSEEVLDATLDIFNSKILKKPKATIRSDSGSEFKSIWHQWFYDQNIYHSTSLPGRHKQTSSVENVNRLIGRFLNNYMNKKSDETNKEYMEWTDILPELVKQLNKIRHRPDEDPFLPNSKTNTEILYDGTKQKFKVGDVVIRKLDEPRNTLNQKQSGKFREGDVRWDYRQPRKITHILLYPKNIRYVLENLAQVSYPESELMATKETESKYNVKKIWDRKTMKKKDYYRVWYKGFLKKDSLWVEEKNLLEDGFEDEINDYNNN